MANIEFDQLIYALTESIVEAQSTVELNQISRLAEYYFDKDDATPHFFNISIPNLDEKNSSSEPNYRIPLLSLVPHGNLVIKEANISFDVDISSITAKDDKTLLLETKIKEEKERANKEKERANKEKERADKLENDTQEMMQEMLNSFKELLTESSKEDALNTLEDLTKQGEETPLLRASFNPAETSKINVTFPESRPKAQIIVDPGAAGIAAKKGNAAKIELKLGYIETSEGLARLLNDVVKTQGHIPK